MEKKIAQACGIVFCFNEEHIIGYCLEHYLSQGIDLVIFDNQSTDSSFKIAEKLKRDNKTKGKILEIKTIVTNGYQWRQILKNAEEYIAKNLTHYTWTLLIDADAFYYSPIENVSLLEFLEIAANTGYNIINGQLCEFYPTEKDDNDIKSPLERIKYCKVYNPDPQHKIIRYHPSVNFSLSAGHTCTRDHQKIFPVNFLYHHYKWTSFEQGLKKVFKERLPRFVEQRLKTEWRHPQYSGIQPKEEEFIKKSKNLWKYQHKEMLISQRDLNKKIFFDKYLFFLLSIKKLIFSFSLKKSLIPNALRGIPSLYRYDKKKALTETANSIKKSFLKGKQPDFKVISLKEALFGPISVWGLPFEYNFIFSEKFTLEKFRKILANIPNLESKIDVNFCFSGKVIIEKDVFVNISNLVKEKFPRARLSTSAELENRPLCKLVDAILIQDLSLMEKEAVEFKNKKFIFLPRSRNVLDPSWKIEKKIDLRILPDYLIFSKEREDLLLDFINKSKSKNKFTFVDFKTRKKQLSIQPWTSIFIEVDSGVVFPIINSQDLFREKISSLEYNFGNLINEHITDIWNNTSYGAIRRSISKKNNWSFIEECELIK